MLKFLRCTLAAAVAGTIPLGVVGCESVETTVLIGERVMALPADWSGSWQIDEEVVHLHVDGSVLHAAHVEWVDGEFKLQKVAAIVTTLGEHRFIHIWEEPDEEGAPDHEVTYGFLIIEQPEKDLLTVFAANPPSFRTAVEAGNLRGEVIRGAPTKELPEGKPQRTILRDKQSLDEFIRRTPIDEIFNREEGLHLKRIVLREETIESVDNE